MAESVADKTPIPTATVRQHTDPPGLWIAVLSCSIMLHISAFLLLRSLSLDSFPGEKTSTEIPIDFIEVDKTQNTQKPKSDIPIKTRSQSPKIPKISPQKVQPVIPIAPQQDALVKLTEGIAFANPRVTKKTATPIPKTKPPIKQQSERKVPPQSQVKSQLEQQFQRELAQQQRQQQLAEQQFQREISQQQRQQELAEQQRQQRITQQELAEQQRQQRITQQELAEQQRQQRITQQELAEQQRQREIAQQQRQQRITQQELAEQQRQQRITQQELAEQQRQQRITQQELAEQQRQQELAEQKSQQQLEQQRQNNSGGERLPPPPNINKTAPGGGRIIKPGENIAIGEGKPLPNSKGFWTASLIAVTNNEQIDLNSITGSGTLESPPQMRQKTTTPNKLPLLNEKDRQLIKQPITCRVLLSIDAKGKIFNDDGIRIADDAPQQDICKRYAEEYFKQNRGNIEFIPRRDKGNVPASGGFFVDLIIQPVATSDGNPIQF